MARESEELKKVLFESSEDSIKKLADLVKDSKIKLFDKPAEGRDVTSLSMTVKDSAKKTINIHTTQGFRWITDERSILNEKRDNIKIMMETPEIKTIDLLKKLDLTPYQSTSFGIPMNLIDSDIIIFYHENEPEGVRRAIAVYYPSLAGFIDEIFKEHYKKAYPLDKPWTAEFQSLIKDLTGKTMETIRDPELLQESSWENLRKVTRSKKYDVYRALLYLQNKDNRPYTLNEISKFSNIKYKTVYNLIKNEFEKGKPISNYNKSHKTSKDFDIVHGYHRVYMVKLTEIGKKTAMIYQFYDLLQQNI